MSGRDWREGLRNAVPLVLMMVALAGGVVLLISALIGK